MGQLLFHISSDIIISIAFIIIKAVFVLGVHLYILDAIFGSLCINDDGFCFDRGETVLSVQPILFLRNSWEFLFKI